MALKTGISGLRGTVAADTPSLTPTVAVAWVQAFVAWLQAAHGPRPTVALGHDARRSSPALAALAKGALLAAGADVVEMGLTLTPTVQMTVRNDAAVAGGLMITASHNPIVWNGLKFLDHEGFFLPQAAWTFMQERVTTGNLPTVALDAVGRVVRTLPDGGWAAHEAAILAALPVETIRARPLRVALDACNGGAGRWASLLAALGCEVTLLHDRMDGSFEREAEPLPQHLGALRDVVRANGCDIGLAADPDGDRLVLVDANGNAVSEEHTVVLAAMAVAEPGDTVVVNAVTTHTVDGALPGVTVVRTAVGEMNVVAGVQQHRAVLGGEGSGGIIVPAINLARDGGAALGLILSLMAQRGQPLHEIVAALPAWRSVKAKLDATHGSTDAIRALFPRWQQAAPRVTVQRDSVTLSSDAGSVMLRAEGDRLTLDATLPDGSALRAEGEGRDIAPLIAALGDAPTLDLTDGVKLSAPTAWLSLRPSNTEPIVRVMGEALERP